jgi:signal peptidase II
MTGTPTTSSRIFGMPAVGLIIAVVSVVLDQLSKYVIVEKVMRPEGVTETPYYADKIIDVLPVFALRMAWNEGISFSLFSSGAAATTAILLTVQIAITIGLVFWLRTLDRLWLVVGAGLIIGGALGNIIDRAMFGAVADFLDFYWGAWHFPTFNIADICISLGAGLWLLDAIFAGQQHTPETPTKDSVP